jgi:hypothetical protein
MKKSNKERNKMRMKSLKIPEVYTDLRSLKIPMTEAPQPRIPELEIPEGRKSLLVSLRKAVESLWRKLQGKYSL